RASDGRRKVAIIAEADRLQPQAANAFLKTLEEPPRNSLLLLLSALPEALPDTIVSRCISIPLAANGEQIEMPERAELIDLLGQTAREVLRRIQRLEELRDHLGRNIQEALAFEAAFLQVFGS